ncbi:thioredoxin [Sinorhizobium meliloti CCBAU 01290]|nr:thioredoxin [Sinorhizobium meliloti CCBAU 01290]
MATVKVDTANFQKEVLNSAEPVVVDFWAEWCGPCKMIAPSLEEIATELAGKVKVVKLNIDENPELAAQYGVRSIPTLAMFKGGEVADIKVGAAPKTALSCGFRARWLEPPGLHSTMRKPGLAGLFLFG